MCFAIACIKKQRAIETSSFFIAQNAYLGASFRHKKGGLELNAKEKKLLDRLNIDEIIDDIYETKMVNFCLYPITNIFRYQDVVNNVLSDVLRLLVMINRTKAFIVAKRYEHTLKNCSKLSAPKQLQVEIDNMLKKYNKRSSATTNKIKEFFLKQKNQKVPMQDGNYICNVIKCAIDDIVREEPLINGVISESEFSYVLPHTHIIVLCQLCKLVAKTTFYASASLIMSNLDDYLENIYDLCTKICKNKANRDSAIKRVQG